ncbi:hypothetical protein QQ045_017868 [Rhodiola kirilowii]
MQYEEKLNYLQKKISQWNRRHFGNVQQVRVNQLKAELEEIHKQERTDMTQQKEEQLIAELDDWLLREEILWKQRSRAIWLEEGDSNTKYFHAFANSTKKSNTIESQTGLVEDDPKKIKDIIAEHFKKVFGMTRLISQQELQTNLSCLHSKITTQHNAILLAPYTAAQVTKELEADSPLEVESKQTLPSGFGKIKQVFPVV